MSAWSSDKIEAVVADDAHGEVLVSVGELKGNSRVLGSWRGEIEYKNISYPCGTPLADQFTVHAHLRADMHAVRELVDGPLLNHSNAVGFFAAPDTRVDWKSEGECPGGDSGPNPRWSGAGSYGVVTNTDGGAMLAGRIDTVDGRFQIAHIPGLARLKTVESLGNRDLEILIIDQELQGFVNDGPDYSRLMPAGTFIPFDAALNVIPDQQQVASPNGQKKLQIKWGSFSVDPAFDDKIGR
ncbi:hypothetical protein [Niveibacterium sp. SC-1]|uniref:hypothetical protein n=1 Tax=Niveibacterium sp. SC-1 TaxID=3135646 RepID=UPI00311F426A